MLVILENFKLSEPENVYSLIFDSYAKIFNKLHLNYIAQFKN